MNALNQIILEGNVVRTPLQKCTPNGKTVCTVPIAVNSKYKNSEGTVTEEVSYFDVDTFGKLAERCAEWCPPGREIRVVGRIKQNRWKDNEGKSHSKVLIIAEHVEFLKLPKRLADEIFNRNKPSTDIAAPAAQNTVAAIKEAIAAASEQEREQLPVF
ncbi:MAG: single-stranded DNA-binding protein [Treponema sp.]|nr:single-stranded DNA-binding protein [Treponema sp.]